MDGSTRSAHSNAFMYGFLNNKRIVLYDTLIDACSEMEVTGVLAHEMGHWKMWHTVKGLAISLVYSLIVFYAFSWYAYCPPGPLSMACTLGPW